LLYFLACALCSPSRRNKSAELNVEFAVIDLHPVSFQINTNRGAFSFSGTHIESTLVQRAFDNIVDYQAISEVLLFVRTQSIGGVEPVDSVVDMVRWC